MQRVQTSKDTGFTLAQSLYGSCLPDCLACPIARLAYLPDWPDCAGCPIGPTVLNARLARLLFARLKQIVSFARLARLGLPDCCPTAIRRPDVVFCFAAGGALAGVNMI